MDGDDLVGEGSESQRGLNSRDGAAGGTRRLTIKRGRVWLTAPYMPDADLPPGADVAGGHTEVEQGWSREVSSGNGAKEMLQAPAKPREVEVRDLKAERAGRVFPCMHEGGLYSGCIGYDACKVLCWSPRPREREALVRVEKPTGGPCRDCVYAREVRGEVALLNGREVRLMECRLGYWHGRTTVHDFVLNKIALNVGLPCRGFEETDAPHPAVARLRERARQRRMLPLVEREAQEDE